jgi:hypothetical protein
MGMKGPGIHLVIEELVIEGFSRDESRLVAERLRQGLERLLQDERGVAVRAAPAGGSETRGLSRTIEANGDAAATGDAAARAVTGALVR